MKDSQKRWEPSALDSEWQRGHMVGSWRFTKGPTTELKPGWNGTESMRAEKMAPA
jgi:hypothetical protein